MWLVNHECEFIDGINYNDDDVSKAFSPGCTVEILYMWRVVLIIGSLQALLP
jgi:hypothetical protein